MTVIITALIGIGNILAGGDNIVELLPQLLGSLLPALGVAAVLAKHNLGSIESIHHGQVHHCPIGQIERCLGRIDVLRSDPGCLLGSMMRRGTGRRGNSRCSRGSSIAPIEGGDGVPKASHGRRHTKLLGGPTDVQSGFSVHGIAPSAGPGPGPLGPSIAHLIQRHHVRRLVGIGLAGLTLAALVPVQRVEQLQGGLIEHLPTDGTAEDGTVLHEPIVHRRNDRAGMSDIDDRTCGPTDGIARHDGISRQKGGGNLQFLEQHLETLLTDRRWIVRSLDEDQRLVRRGG
mmetsp:Transcript_21269/g.61022  ORF Transcript_21269/g.61022 Transcript_21269/m.61022 type:complete len:288 (+) Transcript_21269:3015-3878(+)